ncbi:hypothetical protein [Pyrococcus kukulkanii]|uniref:hypothetical protein n=1 Tax=Pyrococcus kukulkanii TaxID=1609559 RepID=UPI00356A2603
MTSKKKKVKRIYNPLTGKYYVAEIKKNGQYRIIGLWHPPKKKKSRKTSIWELLG